MRRACARTQATRTRTFDLVFVDVWLDCGCAWRCALSDDAFCQENDGQREKEDRWKVSSVQGRGNSTLVAPPYRRKPNKPAPKTTQITPIGDRTLQRNRAVIRFRTVRLDSFGSSSRAAPPAQRPPKQSHRHYMIHFPALLLPSMWARDLCVSGYGEKNS